MGPWDRFVFMLVPIVFILSVTGIIILRPLSKRLGDLLELMVQDQRNSPSTGIEQVMRRLDSIEGKIARIEGSRAIEKGVGPEGMPTLGAGDPDRGEGG